VAPGPGEELDAVPVRVVGQDRRIAAVAFRIQGHRLVEGPAEQSQEAAEDVQPLLLLHLEQADISDDLGGTPWVEDHLDVRIWPDPQ